MDALITADALATRLDDPTLRVLDGTWHMPASGRDPAAEFRAAHIPGARPFGIDAIADPDTDLPHMLPSPEAFATAVGALGIGPAHEVVIYDTHGLMTAPRVWWTFRAFGHDRVRVLDGGAPAWTAAGHALTDAPTEIVPETYPTPPTPTLVRTLDEVAAALAAGDAQVLDARSHGRFSGEAPEPRAGLRGGHMPGSLNLPWTELVDPQGRLHDADALRARLAAAGLDLARPIVTTCGSGITAAVLTLALHRVGRPDVAVYDGSWTEWGGRADTPVAVG